MAYGETINKSGERRKNSSYKVQRNKLSKTHPVKKAFSFFLVALIIGTFTWVGLGEGGISKAVSSAAERGRVDHMKRKQNVIDFFGKGK